MSIRAIWSGQRTATWLATAVTVATLLLAGCAAPGPTTSAFDGVYHGTSFAASSNPMCPNDVGLNPMTVSGGRVEFGNMRGWVDPNGKVQMVFGRVTLFGQFQGNQFQGLFYNPPGCNFRLEMTRVS